MQFITPRKTMAGNPNYLKNVLIFGTISFAMIGFAVFCCGIRYPMDNKEELRVAEVRNVLSYITMAVGGLIFLVSMVGYFGAAYDSRRLLDIFAYLLICFITTEFLLTITYFVNSGNILEYIQKSLKNFFFKSQNDEGLRLAYHVLEQQFYCCGYYGPLDYNITNNLLPSSCCSNSLLKKCCSLPCTLERSNRGCRAVVHLLMLQNNYKTGIFVTSLVAIKILAAVYSLVYSDTLRRRADDVINNTKVTKA